MIAIVDYNAGNLTSVARALAKIGYDHRITGDPTEIENAERVIFPGVGAAGSAMESLKRSGLDEALREVLQKGKPLLGICLGTQIILEKSRENNADCLGLIKGDVRHFPPDMTDSGGCRLKIPHMGWNTIALTIDHPVFADCPAEAEFYFVHSYYPVPMNEESVIATTDYGIAFASVIGHYNLVACQFHPEKSGRPGLRILENFCRWRPC
ncbi:MAG: imidazole glycerol phosphate synthase subunit HisH [Thermodesulfobacteriota bacterium]|nr:imidazole glycerol phosphate synthase subunit HisH [Thermodesulfobacteriota bacterium]